MNILSCSVALAVVSLGLTTAASAEMVEVRWSDTGRFEHAQHLPPGQFAEACVKLSKGQSVRWQFRAAGPTQFNIHYHEGKKVEFPAKVDGAQAAEGMLAVPLDQDYCWMWTNTSDRTLSLEMSLNKAP